MSFPIIGYDKINSFNTGVNKKVKYMLEIKILGPGCTNCVNLENMCRESVLENNINASIEKITDYREIMSYGILSTPGLVINGKVVLTGKLPTKTTLLHWLNNAIAESNNKIL